MRLTHLLPAASILAVIGLAAPATAWEVKPPTGPQPASPTELAARIDKFVGAVLSAKGIEPAPLASDAEFHRRVYLDLAGRIPTEAEVRAFLADQAPDRRGKVVESLLGSPHYVRHWANTWQAIMTPANRNGHSGSRGWLEASVQANTPYDVMVRELLTSPRQYVAAYNDLQVLLLKSAVNNPKNFNPNLVNPNIDLNPAKIKVLRMGRGNLPVVEKIEIPVQQLEQLNKVLALPGDFYFEANEYKPENLAASTARRFLGVRLECAQCHNHPFSSWTRKQFWEFAAFFAGTEAPERNLNRVSRVNSISFDQVAVPPKSPLLKREIAIPGTDKTVDARFPDGTSPVWKSDVDTRQTLAEWLTSPANPYFARTAVNRIWAHFFGAGLIDPVDDEPTEDNPASHSELLAELTAQFIANKHDVKFLIRAITASNAYQRSSAASHDNQKQARIFARMAVKGLTPEQLFDSLATATGYQDPSGHPPGVLVPNSPRGEFLTMFTTQDRSTETQTSILQALTLMNGKLVADATSLPATQKLLTGATTNAARIEILYLRTLSRAPRPEEYARMLRFLDSRPDAEAACSDVLWALLNSSEFRFNH